jgi:hypothetical protein
MSLGNMGTTKITSDKRTVLRKIFCPRWDEMIRKFGTTEEYISMMKSRYVIVKLMNSSLVWTYDFGLAEFLDNCRY